MSENKIILASSGCYYYNETFTAILLIRFFFHRLEKQ